MYSMFSAILELSWMWDMKEDTKSTKNIYFQNLASTSCIKHIIKMHTYEREKKVKNKK